MSKMPSSDQKINVEPNKGGDDTKNMLSESHGSGDMCSSRQDDLDEERKLAFALRDFIGESGLADPEQPERSPDEALPYIDEPGDTDSDEERPPALSHADCRLRRWRAASRKLRRRAGSGGREPAELATELAERLRGLAACSSAGELLPPPAATAPPSPGCLLAPTLADQSEGEYFGSSPECCAEGLECNAPAPPPGPRYKLAAEGALRVCSFQHTRTVVDKILAAKFLRRWETHVLALHDDYIVSKTTSGMFERPLHYSSMQEVYCISRWDPARKYCLRLVMPHGSLLLQANDAYTRDQWYHSILWKRNMVKYRTVLKKTFNRDVVIKELKNMVDFAMTTPLQDESVTRAPLQLLTALLQEEVQEVQEQSAASWGLWAERAVGAAGPLLAERGAAGELCGLLARACRERGPLPALAPPVRRVLTRNVDFSRAPHTRGLVRDYISALGGRGAAAVRRFVQVTHGERALCPHPRAAPNLAAVSLAALDLHFRGDSSAHHVCRPEEGQVLCFADILEQMCSWEDWAAVVSGVLRPVPLCAGALRCPRVARRLGAVLRALARDPRCSVHRALGPARPARPAGWLHAASPARALLALPAPELRALWGDMIGSLLACCCRRKGFLQSMSAQLPDFLLLALSAHVTGGPGGALPHAGVGPARRRADPAGGAGGVAGHGQRTGALPRTLPPTAEPQETAGGGRSQAPGAAGASDGRGRGGAAGGRGAREPRVSLPRLHLRHQRLRTPPHQVAVPAVPEPVGHPVRRQRRAADRGTPPAPAGPQPVRDSGLRQGHRVARSAVESAATEPEQHQAVGGRLLRAAGPTAAPAGVRRALHGGLVTGHLSTLLFKGFLYGIM